MHVCMSIMHACYVYAIIYSFFHCWHTLAMAKLLCPVHTPARGNSKAAANAYVHWPSVQAVQLVCAAGRPGTAVFAVNGWPCCAVCCVANGWPCCCCYLVDGSLPVPFGTSAPAPPSLLSTAGPAVVPCVASPTAGPAVAVTSLMAGNIVKL